MNLKKKLKKATPGILNRKNWKRHLLKKKYFLVGVYYHMALIWGWPGAINKVDNYQQRGKEGVFLKRSWGRGTTFDTNVKG